MDMFTHSLEMGKGEVIIRMDRCTQSNKFTNVRRCTEGAVLSEAMFALNRRVNVRSGDGQKANEPVRRDNGIQSISSRTCW